MVKKINHSQLGQLVKLYYKQQDVITKKKLPLIIYGTFGVGKSTIIRDKSIEIAEEKNKSLTIRAVSKTLLQATRCYY